MRRSAAEALGEFTRHNRKIVPALMPMLQDEQTEVRAAAILSLGKLASVKTVRRTKRKPGGQPAQGASPPVPKPDDLNGQVRKAIEKFADDPDPRTKKNVTLALTFLGDKDQVSVEMLAEGLSDDREAVSKAATTLMRRLAKRKPEETLPGLTAVLERRKEPATKNALKVLRSMREKAAPAIPQIMALYDDGDTERRSYVLRTLASIDKVGVETLPLTVKALDDPEVRVRKSALRRVMSLSKKPDELLEPIRKRLKDENSDNRLYALSIIRGMGVESSATAPEILTLMKDRVISVKATAISAIGSVKSPTKDVFKALEEALGDKQIRARRAALTSLRRIGMVRPESVTPILAKALDTEKDPSTANSIRNVLKRLDETNGTSRPNTTSEGAPRTNKKPQDATRSSKAPEKK